MAKETRRGARRARGRDLIRRGLARFALAVALALALALPCGDVLAQGVAPPAGGARAQEVARPASACDTPASALAAPAPLPHVAAALKSKKIHILIVGSPVGLNQGQRKPFPAALEFLLDRALVGVDAVVADRPVSGETAATAVERMRTEVALDRPDLLVWRVGSDDALQFVAPEDYESAVRAGVRWAKDNGIDVLLVGFETNPWLHDQSEAKAIREATRRVAQSENVLYLRRLEAMQFLAKTRKSVAEGGNPFSLDAGYDCLAEQVAQALVANLVLRHVRPAKP
ncbi:SGNH/GDSL hydrolase family protein [Rhodoblastus sp.]|uniref:SGNH/GDSL hydrolase family protein n=1 Tax=Rhodoblastus sp. TaxID=1962975 RepID=UPI003F9B760A